MFNNLNLNGIPNRIINNEEDRYNLAAKQEQFVVNQLRIGYPDVKWFTLTEYLGCLNPEQNRILGDIVGIRTNNDNVKPNIFIDLKVAEFGLPLYALGGITIDSIYGFGYRQFNHFYLLSNYDGSDWIIVAATDIYNLLNNKITKCLIESKWHKNIKQKYDKFINKYIYPKKLEGVSGKDYIPGYILRKYSKNK